MNEAQTPLAAHLCCPFKDGIYTPMRLGKNQRDLLRALASPSCAMIVPNKVALSLVKRGFMRTENGGFACITPSGLRLLADELEAGRVEDAHGWAAREREKNTRLKAEGKLV